MMTEISAVGGVGIGDISGCKHTLRTFADRDEDTLENAGIGPVALKKSTV
jgi:hypothetical protein